MLFYIAAFLVFMSVAVLPFFIMDRATFLRERGNGCYGVPAYTLSNLFCSIPGTLHASPSSRVRYTAIRLALIPGTLYV